MGAAGGCLAVAIAVAGSPLMPIGPARLAEPAPGIDVNVAILTVGFAVIVLALLAVALLGYLAHSRLACQEGLPGLRSCSGPPGWARRSAWRVR